ncbi:hypothetical protein [Rummeliibacillus pycnus]|uniref:hypothetical protein n=1 Tax=Rummeliibacillus pycnus TaxID=101070 RepID=UPI003D2A31E8
MKKLTIAVFSFYLLLLQNIYIANAANNDFEKYYYDIGYKDISNALSDSSKHFKKNISLPSQLPELTFTHAFGRLNDLKGEVNDNVEFEFLNENLPNNHFKINITPIAFKMTFEEKNIEQKVKLKDGSEAIFSTSIIGFNTLVFEKNDLQYILSIDEKSEEKITLENLIAIANSVK